MILHDIISLHTVIILKNNQYNLICLHYFYIEIRSLSMYKYYTTFPHVYIYNCIYTFLICIGWCLAKKLASHNCSHCAHLIRCDHARPTTSQRKMRIESAKIVLKNEGLPVWTRQGCHRQSSHGNQSSQKPMGHEKWVHGLNRFEAKAFSFWRFGVSNSS